MSAFIFSWFHSIGLTKFQLWSKYYTWIKLNRKSVLHYFLNVSRLLVWTPLFIVMCHTIYMVCRIFPVTTTLIFSWKHSAPSVLCVTFDSLFAILIFSLILCIRSSIFFHHNFHHENIIEFFLLEWFLFKSIFSTIL